MAQWFLIKKKLEKVKKTGTLKKLVPSRPEFGHPKMNLT